jgi:hypothetical protein
MAVIVADDDKVLAIPANIVEAEHCESRIHVEL